MSARDDIAAHFTSDTLANQLIDALVAEVRREDADYIVAIQERVEADEIAEHGNLDHESELQGQAVRTMAAHLRAEARKKDTREGESIPDFFQAGRTYTDGTNYFRIEHVTRHPDRGHLRAIGWMRTDEPDAKWHGDFRDEGEFDGWTDTTNDTTTGDNT